MKKDIKHQGLVLSPEPELCFLKFLGKHNFVYWAAKTNKPKQCSWMWVLIFSSREDLDIGWETEVNSFEGNFLQKISNSNINDYIWPQDWKNKNRFSLLYLTPMSSHINYIPEIITAPALRNVSHRLGKLLILFDFIFHWKEF